MAPAIAIAIDNITITDGQDKTGAFIPEVHRARPAPNPPPLLFHVLLLSCSSSSSSADMAAVGSASSGSCSCYQHHGAGRMSKPPGCGLRHQLPTR
eukprot:749278-Hanusia_phi.AAC.1